MNTKSIIVVAVLAAGFAIGATIVGSRSTVKSEVAVPSEKFLPELQKRSADLARVHIEDGSSSVTLQLTNSVWTIVNNDGYPANVETLQKLVRDLADAKIIEAKTSNPDLYGRLDVEDVTAGAKGTKIEFFDASEKSIAGLILGKNFYPQGGTQSSQRFVRRTGEKQAWLVELNTWVQTNARSWMDTNLASVQGNRVQSVEIKHPDGEAVRIAKGSEGDANYLLDTLPMNRELSSEGRPNEIQNLFSSLRFDDVVAASRVPADAELVSTVTLSTFDGVVIDSTVVRLADGRNVLRFNARLDEETITKVNEARKKEAEEATAAMKDMPEAKAIEPNLLDSEALKKEVATLNEKGANWAYVLPSFAEERFLRRNEYYLKPLTEEEKTEGPPVSAAPTSDGDTSPPINIEVEPQQQELQLTPQ
jgi:hypothetical protein